MFYVAVLFCSCLRYICAHMVLTEMHICCTCSVVVPCWAHRFSRLIRQCSLFVPLIHLCLQGAYWNAHLLYVVYSCSVLNTRILRCYVAVFSVRASCTSAPTWCLQKCIFVVRFVMFVSAERTDLKVLCLSALRSCLRYICAYTVLSETHMCFTFSVVFPCWAHGFSILCRSVFCSCLRYICAHTVLTETHMCCTFSLVFPCWAHGFSNCMSQCFLFVPLVHLCLHGAYGNAYVLYGFCSFPVLRARIF